MAAGDDDGDIDDLLGEVEEDMVVAGGGVEKHKTEKYASIVRSKLTRDMDELLQETDFQDPSPTFPKNIPTVKKPSQGDAVTNRKCFKVFLGKGMAARGCSTPTVQRCCDRLLCLDCDLAALSFDDVRWDGTADYLFLRNNYPDKQRMSGKLKSAKGWRAYCCQCRLVSMEPQGATKPAESLRDQSAGSAGEKIRWVCRKH